MAIENGNPICVKKIEGHIAPKHTVVCLGDKNALDEVPISFSLVVVNNKARSLCARPFGNLCLIIIVILLILFALKR